MKHLEYRLLYNEREASFLVEYREECFSRFKREWVKTLVWLCIPFVGWFGIYSEYFHWNTAQIHRKEKVLKTEIDCAEFIHQHRVIYEKDDSWVPVKYIGIIK